MKLNKTETQIIEAIEQTGTFKHTVFKGFRGMKPSGLRARNALRALANKGVIKVELTFQDAFCAHYKATSAA